MHIGRNDPPDFKAVKRRAWAASPRECGSSFTGCSLSWAFGAFPSRAASQAWPVARHAAVLGCADGGGGEAGAARARALHRNAVDNAGPCVDEARGPDLLGADCSLLELSVLYGRFHGQASLLGTWAFTFGKAAVRCGAAQAVSSWT